MNWTKQLILFLKVLGIVLVAGMAGLFIVSVVSGDEDSIVSEVFDFSAFIFGEKEKEKEENKLMEEEVREVTLLFAGDILFDDNYSVMGLWKQRGGELTDVFSIELINKMQSADIFMINNEFTFTDRGTPTSGKKFTFRAKPEYVHYYNQMGVDIVSVANNHIYDYGEISLLDTLSTLEKSNVPYVGAGRNISDAMQPYFTDIGGTRIAFVSATQVEKYPNPDTKGATDNSAGVLRCYEPAVLQEVIRKAKEESDFVVLYIHWGTESQEETDWLQDTQAPLYVEAGADLIIGDHPHCLQKIDVINGVPVVYSVGNFLFNSKTQDSCMIEAKVEAGKLRGLRFIPCRQSDCRTEILHENEAVKLIRHIDEISPGISIDQNGKIIY